ncbi:MAG: RDD family protein [Blastocatellia bacterium]
MPRHRNDDDAAALDNSRHQEMAGISARCSAFLLDYILTLFPLAVTLVLAFYVKRRLLEPTVADFFQYVGYALVLAVIFANWIYGYVRFGQSFGKRFIGLRLIRVDGQPVDYKTATVRLIGSLLSVLVFGYGFLRILWDDEQRGWHDMLAGTMVVKD